MKKQENMRKNKEFLDAYMLGFKDELSQTYTKVDDDLKYSYELGRDHAVIGDEISSIDSLTNEEILIIIKNHESKNQTKR